MRTKTETVAEQHDKLVDALAELEQAALDFSATGRAAYPRKRLARAAVAYAARLRRLAGVR